MALGKGKRHQPGNGGGIDLERVEAQIGLFGLVGEPGGEGFNIEGFTCPAGVTELLFCQKHQRVQGCVGGLAPRNQHLFGAALGDTVLGMQRG